MPKAPNFWFTAPEALDWRARALAPLGALYAKGTAFRVAKAPKITPAIPVICVGNLTAGGAGKTPTTIAMAQLYLDHGLKPHIVSRGYGGTLEGPVQVDPASHSAADVGDEPLLLAAFGPTWVAKSRDAGVAAAEKAGADVILLDDGFQNPDVAKSLAFVVVNARRGFGNGRVLPAGPLREPVAHGLKRADAIVLIGTPQERAHFSRPAFDGPVFEAELKPLFTGMPWEGLPVYAFAGIANPHAFFQLLKRLGADVRGEVALGDHETFSPALLQRLEHEAKTAKAQLVTTEKDAARLPDHWRPKALTLPVRLEFTNPEELWALLKSPLRQTPR